MMKDRSNKVVAFYGFKGGAGRSMLLVNLAGAMARQNKRVLIIDCDLEAPGLGDYLIGTSEPYARWRENHGIVDLIVDQLESPPKQEAIWEVKPQSALEETGAGSFQDMGSLHERVADATTAIHLSGENAANDVLNRFFGEEKAKLNPETSEAQIRYLMKVKTAVNKDAQPSSTNGNEESKNSTADPLEGSIYLLGPGTHEAEVPYPQQYAGRVVDLDWNLLASSREGNFLKRFGEALQSQTHFDYVLIDARTGYNFAAIALVQNWATDLVAVGTMSLQSIDGLARMMPIFSDIGIRCHLAISKASLDQCVDTSPQRPGEFTNPKSDPDGAIKKELIEQYHHNMLGSIYWFPFLDELKFGEEDLWSRYPPSVMDEPSASKGPNGLSSVGEESSEQEEQEGVRSYARAIFNLYRSISGNTSVSRDRIRATFHGKSERSTSFDKNSAPSSDSSVNRGVKRGEGLKSENVLQFLQRVEDFCRVNEQDKPQSSALPREGGGNFPSPDKNATPLLNDAELSEVTLAARDLARVELAKKLRDWGARPNEYDKARMEAVRRKNGIYLLPVAVKDLPKSDDWSIREQGPANPEPLVWTAFGAAVQNPSDEANIERITQARKALGTLARFDEKLTRALDLAESIVHACPRSTTNEPADANERLAWMLDLGSKLLPLITTSVVTTEFHRPTTSAELIRWNPYDAFLPYALAVSEALSEGKSDALLELGEQLKTVQAFVIDGLTEIDLRSEIKDDRQELTITSFSNYLRAALQARRVFMSYKDYSAPHPLTSVLHAKEADTLNRCFDIDGYKGSLETTIGTAATEFQRACGIQLSIIVLTLSGQVKDATNMLSGLRLRLMRQNHPSNLTAQPPPGNPSERYQRYQQYQKWAYFILDLGHLAAALKDDAESSRLYRLALRSYMPIRREKDTKDDFLTVCSASLAVSLSRIGPPIDDRTVEELKPSDPRYYGWWPAARLFVQGHSVEALRVLDSDDKFNDDSSAIIWRCRCQAYLGNLVKLEQSREHWWVLRAKSLSLFSDHLRDWVGLLHMHAGASFALGETRRAIELLEVALEHLKGDELPGKDRLRIALEIRLKLATLRDASDGDKTELRAKASKLADEASWEIVEYLKALQQVTDIGCDRTFSIYLHEAAGKFAEQFLSVEKSQHEVARYEAGGVFAGIEAPSPLRWSLGELLTEFAELLFYAEREEDLWWLSDQMKNVLPDFQVQARFATSRSLSFCYPSAAILALRSTTLNRFDERTRCQAEAREYMRRDIEINETVGRAQYYARIFGICGFG